MAQGKERKEEKHGSSAKHQAHHRDREREGHKERERKEITTVPSVWRLGGRFLEHASEGQDKYANGRGREGRQTGEKRKAQFAPPVEETSRYMSKALTYD